MTEDETQAIIDWLLRNPPEIAPDGSRLCRFPGQPLPPVPEDAYPPGATPLDEGPTFGSSI